MSEAFRSQWLGPITLQQGVTEAVFSCQRRVELLGVCFGNEVESRSGLFLTLRAGDEHVHIEELPFALLSQLVTTDAPRFVVRPGINLVMRIRSERTERMEIIPYAVFASESSEWAFRKWP